MITEEIAIVGSVYCLSLRDSVVQYHSINATMNIAFTLLCVGRTVFGQGEPGCFHSIVASNVVRTSEPKFRPE